MKLVSITSIQPGHTFMYGGMKYIRASDMEATQHPARELLWKHPGLVFAYGLGKQNKRTPVSFLEDAQIKVVIP